MDFGQDFIDEPTDYNDPDSETEEIEEEFVYS